MLNLTSLKLKSAAFQTTLLKEMKNRVTNREKIFVIRISDKIYNQNI